MRSYAHMKKWLVGTVAVCVAAAVYVWWTGNLATSSGRDPEPNHHKWTQPVISTAIKTPKDTQEYFYERFIKKNHSIEERKVKRNESLAQILLPLGVSSADIYKLAKNTSSTFNVRKIKAGRPYSLIFKKDSTRSLRALVYEADPVNYIIYDLEDSLNAGIYQKPVDTVSRAAAGVITSSLYQDLKEQDYPIELIVELEKLFAWQVDFFHVDKYDKYKVFYNEHLVEGKVVGVGRIHAALFEHRQSCNYAIGFQQDSTWSYFDEKGLSVRKAFLRAPLKYSRISSRYQPRRFHPVLSRVKAHLGTDYAAPTGTPIHAVGEGTVIAARYSRYNGNYVKIRHNSTYTTQYLHMSKIASNLRKGTRVEQGQTIGYVGSTGLATGPHLCYRFWMNGRQVDPFSVEMPPAEPIHEKYKEEYDSVKTHWVSRLDALPLPELQEAS